MKLKKDYSLFARAAETLTGAGRVAAVLLVMLFSMTAQTVWAESATVTLANFSNFFDQDGYLLESVTSDELIFQGDFSGSDLVNYIVLDRAITITGDKENTGNKAKFNDIGFVIAADGVTLKNVTLEATTSLGELIYVNGSDVTLDGVSVTYNAPNYVEAKAIFADGAENFQLINSEITFTGADPDDEHYRGLEVSNCNGAIIDNNTITATFPAVPVYWDEMGTIDQDLVLAVGIQGGEDVEFTNNSVTVNTNGDVGSYPTIDAVMVYSANDILIKGNDITHVDNTTENGARYYYSLDIYSTTGTVEANDIIVNTTTTVDRAGTAYAIQVSGPFTITVKDNNLTAISKGSVAGIYSTNWAGPADLTVENNIIEVTGYATTSNYALVAGIEAEIDVLKAYNNTITIANGADYDDANQVIGVGIGYTYFYGDASADIKDNNITVDGQYAVYYAVAATATVTGNALCAHELTGDDAVYIKSGNNNTVENNVHGYVNMPKTGEDAYNIPANVPSFKVYDDGGTSRKYSPDCAGTLKLTAPEGFQLQLSGNIKTEKSADYLTVYDGSSNQAAKLINQVSSSDNGTLTAIPTVISTGRNMTIYFCSNNSNNSEYDGLDLTVNVVKVLSETTGITDADAALLKGKTAQFSRTFTSGVASTICLPFPMTGLAENTVYEMTSMDKTGEDWEATMSAVTSTVAGKPYLIKTDGEVVFSGTVPNDFDGTAGTSSATYSGDGSWTFRGTYTTLTYGTNLDGAVYGFAGVAYNGGSYSVSPGDFVKAESGAYISPFRCYLTYNAPSQARGVTRGADIELPSRIIVRLVGSNGQTTAIGSMDTRTGEVVFGDAWYTLDGRKLNGKPNAKGLFIHDGKKVVIK
jgi:hypothetical protein